LKQLTANFNPIFMQFCLFLVETDDDLKAILGSK
jgi:hypothetical protein